MWRLTGQGYAQAETFVQAEEHRLSDSEKDGLNRQALLLLVGLLDEERDTEPLQLVSGRLNAPLRPAEPAEDGPEETEDNLRQRLSDGRRALPMGRGSALSSGTRGSGDLPERTRR